MKPFIFILFVFISFGTIVAQKSIVVYSGLNLTNTKYHLIDNISGMDSTSKLGNSYLLPHVGIDLNFKFNRHLYLTTGLGVSIMGSRNYSDFVPEGIRLDQNLRLNYLRVPISFNYTLGESIALFAGYSFNYCYRKNHNFFAPDFINMTNKNIFNTTHHALSAGIKYKISKWYIYINYYKGLNRIWDTKDFYASERAYLTMDGLQFSLGYTIEDN